MLRTLASNAKISRKRRRKSVPPARRLAMGARNALEILRLGRLSPRAGAPYTVVHQETHYKLRRYTPRVYAPDREPVLLVPPLMLTAEIYDVAPDISAARTLLKSNLDVFVVDFGAPEHEEGGMERTLDDHVRSVADAIANVAALSGRAVHVAGYSQGGMFAYQAAAYCQGTNVASIITFGSPVDIHRSLPRLSTDSTAQIIRALRVLVEPTLRKIDGLPGVLTSTGFKLLSLRKELGQLIEFLTLLHDRRALQKREDRRKFLAGEGFVAWPGPALLKFIDEFVVHNRLMSGGFVIDGRTVTLADVRVPILYFVGDRDDVARAASVRAVRDAVSSKRICEAQVHSGHFGLVVGSTAMRDTWPTVVEWVAWLSGTGRKPRLLREDVTHHGSDEDAAFDAELDIQLFYDTALRTLDSFAKWLSDSIEDFSDTVNQIRYQLPRLMSLRHIEDRTEVSSGRSLAEQATRNGERTFFLYKGRAVTYAEANQRVDYVVRGLIDCGVRPEDHVGVLMGPRPSYLTIVAALNRLGAVAVLVKPTNDTNAIRRCIDVTGVRYLIADPENAGVAREVHDGRILVLGGGPNRSVVEGVRDMEAIDPNAVELPGWYRENPGRAADLAIVLVTASDEGIRTARITNRRWAFSAFGASAACTLTPGDTVYCCLPLHHPAGLLVSVGAASASGARLALATQFEPRVFWDEVRRYGATVVYYAGEMCRALVDAPPVAGERNHSIRLFSGSGMRADVWQRLTERFGVGVLEFYAPTEVSLVLANADGKKPGSIGRPLPGSREPFLAAFDLERFTFDRDESGHLREAAPDGPGILLARVESSPLPLFDESPLSGETPGRAGLPRTLHNVRADGDTWFVTSDVVRRDAEGDYWFVDRLTDLIATASSVVPSRPLEDALYQLEEVALCAAYGLRIEGHSSEQVVVAIVKSGEALDLAKVRKHLRTAREVTVLPAYFRLLESIPMTDGYRVLKAALRAQGLHADGTTWEYNTETDEYRLLEQ